MGCFRHVYFHCVEVRNTAKLLTAAGGQNVVFILFFIESSRVEDSPEVRHCEGRSFLGKKLPSISNTHQRYTATFFMPIMHM